MGGSIHTTGTGSSNPLRSASESSGFRDSLISYVKDPHLAGIRHSRSTGELLSLGFKREFWRFLSVYTLGGGLSLLMGQCGRLLTGACSGRLRKSEGSLLRRPVHWDIRTAGP
jgi:hypothetical protein